MNVPQAANTRLVERFTELAIQTFLWAFRIVVILVVVVGSILTLVGGRYSAARPGSTLRSRVLFLAASTR